MVRTDTSEAITMHEEDEYWVIKHHETGVVTQGSTRLRALLMLADAIAAHENADEDLMAAAEDIFILDEEDAEFLEELDDAK